MDSLPAYRPLLAADRTQVTDAIEAAVQSVCPRRQHLGCEKQSKSWVESVDVRQAVDNLYAGNPQAAVLDESILVAFSIGAPWWNNSHIIVQECIVIALNDRAANVVAKASAFLKHVCEQVGGQEVVVGTALARSDRAVERLYQRQGFHPAGHQLSFRGA